MVIIREKKPDDNLEEMSALHKVDTGLPVNLWIDNSSSYKRSGHWKRIKFQGDYGNRMSYTNLVSMSISSNPEIFPSSKPVKLPAKDIERIKQFVINNEKILSDLADEKISWKDFFSKLIRG